MAKPAHLFIRYTALAKALTGVGLTQSLLQGLNLATGLMVVRWLTPVEFAYYSIAAGVLGFMSVLTDSGMGSGAYAVAGKIWRDPHAMGDLVATYSSLRRRFTIGAMILALPVMVWLLHRNGADWGKILGLCLVCGLSFWVALPALAYGLAPALHQKIYETQIIALLQAILRLGTLAVALSLSAKAFLVFMGAIPGQIYANIRLGRLSASLTAGGIHREDHCQALLGTVRKVLPGAFYYAMSGQITVLLVSVFGKIETLAEVGALSRLGQIFVVFSSVSSVLLIPRFARMEADPARLIKIYASVLSLVGGACAALCLGAAIFPSALLWLLGDHYQNLDRVVWLQFLVASVGLLAGVAYQIGAVRGIVYSPSLAIPASIVYQVLGVILFDFSTVEGVLVFALVLNVMQLVQTGAFFIGTILHNDHTRK